MKWLIVGLGNPGEEYATTRHNTGRMAVEALAKANKFPLWEKSANAKALYTKEKVGKHMVELILPETFMNKSGHSVRYAQEKHKIKKEHIVVVYDDIDLPFGSVRISFGRGSGGHKGVESIVKSIKTKDFIRVRVGIAPTTPSGKLKKPQGEEKVHAYILGAFTSKEQTTLKKLFKTTSAILNMIITDGYVTAMNNYN